MRRSLCFVILLVITQGVASMSHAVGPPPDPIEIEAKGPNGPLRGTMQPASRADAPVVLILPGSGPTDRNGINPLGVGAPTYRLLAEGLANNGVASARIDKRGLFGSKAAVPDGNDVTIDAYADDVASWISVIRAKTGVDCVWLAGHSEGGLIALVASRSVPDICGLVLLAAAGRRLAVVLREQLKANPANAPILPSAFAAIDKLERGERVDVAQLHPGIVPLFHAGIQKFWINVMSYDPAALLGGYAGPTLIVQGEEDLQVKPEDARRLAAAQPRAGLEIWPGMNHVLTMVPPGDIAANRAAYANKDLPLAPGLAELIATFILTPR